MFFFYFSAFPSPSFLNFFFPCRLPSFLLPLLRYFFHYSLSSSSYIHCFLSSCLNSISFISLTFHVIFFVTLLIPFSLPCILPSHSLLFSHSSLPFLLQPRTPCGGIRHHQLCSNPYTKTNCPGQGSAGSNVLFEEIRVSLRGVNRRFLAP